MKSATFRLHFLRWLRTADPLACYHGQHTALMQQFAQELDKHADRLELQAAISVLSRTPEPSQ